MMEVIERIEYVKVVKRAWAEDSFNERTGNQFKSFKPNQFTNEVL